MARNSKYKKKYIKEADVYLSIEKDSRIKNVKQVNEAKGYKMYETRLKVKLPTHEGFARYLGVTKKTLYNWLENFPKFGVALDKITEEQKKRLVNMGLSGEYNSTIAKLILSSNHGMVDRLDQTSKGKKINTFNDEQVDRIANRIARRAKNDGNTSGTEKSN